MNYEAMRTEELCGRLRQAGDPMLAEVANRLEYLESQEGLLEQAQQRAAKLDAAIDEIQRPLDDQMARLNTNLTRVNAQLVLARHLLVWALYHHQGGSSPVGQPIRSQLGIGRFESIPSDQLAVAKVYVKTWSDRTGIVVEAAV